MCLTVVEPFFSFPPKPKIKSSLHEKKIKNFVFLKNGCNGFHQILRVYSTIETQQYDTIGFSRKIPEIRKIVFNFLSIVSSNVAPKPTDQSCSNSIFRVLLQLSPVSLYHFRPTLNIKGTLMLRVVHIRNCVADVEFYEHDKLFLLLCY